MSPLQPGLGLSKAPRALSNSDKGPLFATLALSVALLMAGLGVIIDDSSASNARTTLDALADAAVLAGVSATNMAVTANAAQRETRLEELMRQDFDAQLDLRPGLRGTLRTATFAVDIMRDTIVATTCYRADLPTIISRFLGQEPLVVQNCASALSEPRASEQTVLSITGAAAATGDAGSLAGHTPVAATPGTVDVAVGGIPAKAGGQRQVRLLR